MEKKDLVKLIDGIFIPLNFKRKGNSWVDNSGSIIKIINLQKSNYGNAFYINYGYIIPGLELTTTTHIENRLASTDKDEQEKITKLLDLDTEIKLEERLEKLERIIVQKIVTQVSSIQTEADLLKELKSRPSLNDVPLVVKRHFNLE